MVDSRTMSRADALQAAGDVVRMSVENIVKEAVADAMREVENEQGSVSSNRRRIPAALLLLAIGALVGYALASRTGSDEFETEGLSRSGEPEPSRPMPAGQRTEEDEREAEAGMSVDEGTDETVDAVTED